MDITKPTLVSFCSGYGGLELGIEQAIGRKCFVLSYAEIEAPAVENLIAKMEAGLIPPAPVWTDLKTFPSEGFHDMVDILCGGYPCQPFSAAGKRLGAEDPRHLWPYIRMHIAKMRPAVCFFENVDGHISMGLMEVIADLRALGYRVENGRQEPTWGVFSASEVGAPHQRKRVFILAVREDLADSEIQRIQGCGTDREQEPRSYAGQAVSMCSGDSGGAFWPSRPGQPQWGWEPPRVLANSERPLQERRGARCGETTDRGAHNQPGRPGLQTRETQPPLGGDSHGSTSRLDLARLSGLSDQELAEILEWMERTSNRVDELRLLGNGVVPATAKRAWRELWGRVLGYAKSND